MTVSQMLADIYQRWTLDPVIQIAVGLSIDVPNGSARYHAFSDETRKTLAEFSGLTGKHPEWPDVETRKSIYDGLLGQSFSAAATYLRRTAMNVAQSGPASGRAAQLAFRDAVSSFRSVLATLPESAVTEVHDRTKAIFERATRVLGDQHVASAFGLKRVTATNWPLGNSVNGEGALLVEELSRLLQPPYARGISRHNFLTAQRVAHYGAQSIRQIVDASRESAESSDLYDAAYNWSVAFQDLVPNVIRAWRDPEYRRGLSMTQQAHVPDHPAGEIELPQGELTLRRGRPFGRPTVDLAIALLPDTYTTFGEVCCCNSMDLCETERSVICLC
jgi:mersacidin/lichenicidin family type 2 lantibiotic